MNDHLKNARALAVAYLITIVVCALLLSSSLFAYDPAAWLLKVVLVILVVWTVYRGSGLLLFMCVQLYLAQRQWSMFDEPTRWDTLMISMTTVALVVLASRFRTLMQLYDVQGIVQMKRFLLQEQSDASELGTPPASVWSVPLISLFLGATACVVLSMVAMALVPADSRAPRMVGLMPTALRAIELGCLLTTTFLIVTIFVGELQWRRMTPRAAHLYLQSLITNWCFADFRLVARKRRRLHRRASRS